MKTLPMQPSTRQSIPFYALCRKYFQRSRSFRIPRTVDTNSDEETPWTKNERKKGRFSGRQTHDAYHTIGVMLEREGGARQGPEIVSLDEAPRKKTWSTSTMDTQTGASLGLLRTVKRACRRHQRERPSKDAVSCESPTRLDRSTAHSSSMHASWLLLPVRVCPVQGQRRFPSLIRGQGVRSWHRRSGAPRASRCSLVPSGQIRLPNASTPLRGSRISRRVVRIRHAQRHRAS